LSDCDTWPAQRSRHESPDEQQWYQDEQEPPTVRVQNHVPRTQYGPQRGPPPSRGRRIQKSRARRHIQAAVNVPAEELDNNEDLGVEREDEGSMEDVPSVEKDDNRIFEDITSAAKKLSIPVQKARKVLMVSASVMFKSLLTGLQDMERRHFRALCGVTQSEPWPFPDGEVRLKEGTDDAYYTPDFRLGVTAKVNVDLFKRVVDLTMQEIVSRKES
jgi:hypothetical protein